MKILSIRIKNLASLAGEHFIDFETEPLASAGLIAIVGKTGAGKSTILDAMCLALFNRIPRLKDSDGKIIDVDGSELPSNSPLTVLRRGTAHGFAELCFIAQDQKRYLARWEIKRSREKANGKLQSVQRVIRCLSDDVVLADKTKAVDETIRKITQLSFEQFTRAVLLAQSEVTAFLKARDHERGELLEYLTNSSIFARIGQLAFEKTKQISLKRKDLENVLGHIEILSEDEIKLLQTHFQQHDQHLQQLEANHLHLQHLQRWYERQQQLQQDIEQKQQYVDHCQQQVDQLQPQRDLLQQLQIFAEIRPYLIQQHSLRIDLEKLQPQLHQAEHQFTNVQQRFESDKSEFDQCDQRYQKQQQFEHEHHAQLQEIRQRVQQRSLLIEQFTAAKQRLNQLQQVLLQQQQHQHQQQLQLQQIQTQYHQAQSGLDASQPFASLDRGLKVHLEQLQRFIDSFQQFETAHGPYPLAQLHLQQQQTQLEQLLAQHGSEETIQQNLIDARLQRDQLMQQQHQLALFQQQYQRYAQAHTEQQQLTQQLDKLQAQIQQLQQQRQQAEQYYLQQKQQREQLQQILMHQRLLHDENIEQLRQQLETGKPCLLCGSTEHPYANVHSDLSKELYNLQQQQEQQALAAEQQHFEQWQQLQGQEQQQLAQVALLQQRHQALHTNVQQFLSELQQVQHHLKAMFDLSQSPAELQSQFQQQQHQDQQFKEQLEQQIQQLLQVLQQQQQLHKQVQALQHQISRVELAQEAIQPIMQLLPESERTLWHSQTLSQAQQLAQRLHTRLLHLQRLEQFELQLQQAAQQLQQVEQQIAFQQQQIKEAELQQEQLKQQGMENVERAKQLILNMSQEDTTAPATWLDDFENKRQHLQQTFNQLRQRYDQSRQHYEQLLRQLEQLRAQHGQLLQQQQQQQAEVSRWLEQHPQFDVTTLECLMAISTAEEQHIRQQLQICERQLHEAQSALHTLQAQMQQHLQQTPEISRDQLQHQLTTLIADLQQVQTHRDELKLKLEIHQQNLEKQQQFLSQIQQIQAEEHRWSKISSLIGDAKGKEFRDLAQQYNLDILLEYANQQLCLLSQRYTLKRLDNSLSLAIIDHDMDGETRAVASLSGGESFLTALALSLAIANMASGSMKIESLFIDEGFGTLDASSLHMVMNALDQLQSQGRKVVLISHIQEMHERIPVQIQVNPLGAGASTIEVRC